MAITLCASDSIPEGKCRAFETNEHSFFIVRHQGKLHGYINQCPHIGVPLNWLPDQFLDSDQELIQCSTHGALFLIENGKCISGPCNGQSLRPIAIYENDGTIGVNIEP